MIEQEEPEEGAPVWELVAPALDRSSALADRLARLLVPASLFS